MRRCPKCGAEVKETAKFCKYCGEPLTVQDSGYRQTDPTKNREPEPVPHENGEQALFAKLSCRRSDLGKIRQWQVETEEGMVSIQLPEKVEDGQVIPYPGKGRKDPNTGEQDVLYVTVQIKKEPLPVWLWVLAIGICVAAVIVLALTGRNDASLSGMPDSGTWQDETGEYGADSYDEAENATEEWGEPAVLHGQIHKLASGNYHSVLLRDDGSVAAAGYNGMGSKANFGGRCDTEDWGDMVCVAASSHTAGVRADGTVVATGLNESGQCYVEDWYDIASVAVSNHHTVGLCYDGTVVAAGANDYGQCEVYDWENIVQVAASEETTYGLTADGRVISAGKRSFGRDWWNVKAIAASAYNLVALLEDGTVVQEGTSSTWDDTTDDWYNIVDIAAGGTHTLGLTADGRVLCAMTPVEGRDHGQWDVSTWEDIVDISAGMFFSVGLKADGTIVAVGDDTHGELDIRWIED